MHPLRQGVRLRQAGDLRPLVLSRTGSAGPGFAYCRERLAPHKTPRHWRVVDAFPLTPSGKVKKYVLREELLADLPAGALAGGPLAGGPDLSAAPPG